MCLPEIVVPYAQIEFILLSNWPDAHPTPTHEMPVDSVPTRGLYVQRGYTTVTEVPYTNGYLGNP